MPDDDVLDAIRDADNEVAELVERLTALPLVDADAELVFGIAKTLRRARRGLADLHEQIKQRQPPPAAPQKVRKKTVPRG